MGWLLVVSHICCFVAGFAVCKYRARLKQAAINEAEQLRKSAINKIS
jgi:hypothetical protein